MRDEAAEATRRAARDGEAARRAAAARGWGRARRATRRALAAAVVLATLGAIGCASVARHAARPLLVGPDGQELPERALRATLAASSWDAALAHALSPRLGGPSDEILRDLYAGTVAYYAGRFDESVAALDRAEALSEDRYTKSLSRGALAIATNDRALPYVPGQTERLFVHYYAMLGFLQRRDADGAAVEARRLGFLLQQYDERRDSLDVSTRAVLRYLTGAAFEAAGERNDADVAYRNAAALLGGALPEARSLVATTAASADWRRRRAPAPPTGDVVVVVEQGFVAHRVSEAMYLGFASDDEQRRFAERGRAWDDDPALARAIARLGADAGLWAGEPPPVLALGESMPGDSARTGAGTPTDSTRGDEVTVEADASSSRPTRAEQRTIPPADGTRVHVPMRGRSSSAVVTWSTDRPAFKLAWPAYRRGGPHPLEGAVFLRDRPPLALDGAAPAPAAMPARGARGARAADPDTVPRAVVLALCADVSDAVAADLKRDRAKLLARMVARAAARAALLAQAKKKSRDLAEILGNASAVVEQADTRSWHLLPGSIGVTRLRLPVGRHALVARIDGRDVPVGEVEVAAGEVAVVTTRAWGGAPPIPPRRAGDRI